MALDSKRRSYPNDPVRELMEAREKAHKDELNRLHTAYQEGYREGFEEGYRKGFEVGYRKGFEVGYRKGFEEGLREARAEVGLQMARALKADGVDAELICRVLGLSPEQLAESD